MALAVDFARGFSVGKLRQWFNAPSFFATLALFTALRGVANLITGGILLTTFPKCVDFLGGGYLIGIPFPIYIFALTLAGMHFLMNFTRFARSVCAVGGNMEAARLSGIGIWWIKSMSLGILGVLTAISGTLTALQIGSGNGTTATGIVVDVIAAVIMGGTSLFGGKGRVWEP